MINIIKCKGIKRLSLAVVFLFLLFASFYFYYTIILAANLDSDDYEDQDFLSDQGTAYATSSTGGVIEITDTRANSGTYSLRFGGQNNTDQVVELSIDTTGYKNIVVNYYKRETGGWEATDYFQFDWYDGSSWNVEEQIFDDYGNWSLSSSTLSSAANNNSDFKIRFTHSNPSAGNIEYAYIDDLSVTGDAIDIDFDQIHYRWRNDNGAETWYNSSWGYRKKITIDSNKVSGSSNLTNFPMLISTTTVDWKDTVNGGNVGQDDGDDILFTASDGVTKLDHEIEYYASSTGELVAWVKIPTLDYDDDTEIYIYYGNAGVANQENPTGVWDTDYEMVQHLEETGIGTREDSTSNNNDGTTSGYDGDEATASGQIDGADDLDGTNDTVNCGNAAGLSFDASETYTYSVWFRAQTGGANYWPNIIGDDDGTGADGFGFYWEDGDLRIYENSGNADVVEATGLNTNTWYYGVFTYDNGDIELFLDGSSEDTGTDTFLDSTGDFIIGVYEADGSYFDGEIDEVRVSSIVRSDDWIATEFSNQSDPGNFYSVSNEDSSGSAATWAANEDTKITGLAKDAVRRLRFEVSNEGADTGSVQYRLEVSGANPTSCATASYTRVDSSADWTLTSTAYYADGDSSINMTGGLTDENTNFIPGEQKELDDQTSSIELTASDFTEIEYAIKATASATDGADYCFRLTNAGSTNFFTYTKYAEAQLAGGGSLSITSPASLNFSAVNFSFAGENSTGNTLGTVNAVDSRGGSPGWTVNVAGEDWATSTLTMDYDGDGISSGQLTIDLDSATITANTGTTTGVNYGSTDSFSTATSSINIISATAGNGTGDYDLDNINLDQFIPPNQESGDYNMTLTLTIS